MKNSGTPMHKLPRKLQDQVAAQLYSKECRTITIPPHFRLPFPGDPDFDPKKHGFAKVMCNLAGPSKAYPFTLWLDYRVPSLNTILGRVRRTILEKKKAAAALAGALAVTPGYPRAGTQRMHVIVTCYVIKQRDADNPVPKFVIDQLRYQGVLRDDDPGSMALTVNPDVKVAKKKLEGTKITIVEALP